MATTYKQGCIDVIQLDEKLTIQELPQVRALLDSAIHERLPQLVADLRRVRVIDSAGLELLFDAQQTCLQRGGSIRLASAGVLMQEVLRITGLNQEFSQYPDVVAAAGAFAV
ncbi:MAG: STAS domain-containing protein [Planctomycetaceae bacterium]|nr:STAS domain-containing protein [Planctomycetaceae bacterium]